jgi:hypothetical protein
MSDKEMKEEYFSKVWKDKLLQSLERYCDSDAKLSSESMVILLSNLKELEEALNIVESMNEGIEVLSEGEATSELDLQLLNDEGFRQDLVEIYKLVEEGSKLDSIINPVFKTIANNMQIFLEDNNIELSTDGYTNADSRLRKAKIARYQSILRDNCRELQQEAQLRAENKKINPDAIREIEVEIQHLSRNPTQALDECVNLILRMEKLKSKVD